jgi:hypothetical protein
MALIMGEGRVSSARLLVPAVPSSLRLARLTASSLAADLDWSLDDIEDLRIAVDELTAALMAGADDATLELDFTRLGRALAVAGTCDCEAPMGRLDPLALELLELTTDRFSVDGAQGVRQFYVEKSPAPTEDDLSLNDASPTSRDDLDDG